MLYDTHAHLSGLKERGVDTHKIIKDIFASGFSGIIDISLEPGDLAARIEEFSVYPKIHFASGLWPWGPSIDNRETRIKELEKSILNIKNGEHALKFCALGEFGLDHNWNGEGKEGSKDLEGEKELMEMQLDLAEKLGLPVIIHSRDAAKETASILTGHPQVCGVVHCFSYGPDWAKIFLDLGYYISFAGNLSYKNAQIIQDACKIVPGDRLFLETDCPYLAPVPHRGKPSHPLMVEEVYRKAAEIRCTNIETLAEQIKENVKTLFGF
jgi:TatD DNase family protein